MQTRILLSLWDPGLVEEALAFVEEYKVAPPVEDDLLDGEEGLCSLQQQTLSPYRRITQQLNFDLKSPDVDDLVTPDSPHCTKNFWNVPSNGAELVDTSKLPNNCHSLSSPTNMCSEAETQFEIFPDADDENNMLDEKENCGEKDKIMGNGISTSDVEDGPCKRFLDTQVMCSSPSANYYKPTDEPEPWDLTQLNIEASVMCLVSKVKFLCGRCGSPAVRLRSSKTFKSVRNKDPVVTVQPTRRNGNLTEAEDSSGLTADMSSEDVLNKTVDTVQKAVNGATVRNKFTEGLDFASIVDWTCELRPSMRKLRQAMDGLLKTARLTHSVFRVQEDGRAAQRACNVRYRRDVCFSQAVSAFFLSHINE